MNFKEIKVQSAKATETKQFDSELEILIKSGAPYQWLGAAVELRYNER